MKVKGTSIEAGIASLSITTEYSRCGLAYVLEDFAFSFIGFR